MYNEGLSMEPSMNDIKKLTENDRYSICPVSSRIPSDGKTPMDVLRILMNVSKHCYLLESVDQDKRWGRYSFLGYDPKLLIACSNGHMRIGDLKIETDDPNKYIRQVLEEHRSPKIPGLPPFTGGLVGYFSYDYLKYAEPTLHNDVEDTEGFQDVDLMLFDKVIAFDNISKEIVLISNVDLSEIDTSYNKAALEITDMIRLIKEGEDICRGKFDRYLPRELIVKSFVENRLDFNL